MPKGKESKNIAIIERQPENAWIYYCNKEIVKKCKNKKSFDLWVKLHLKHCISCQQRELFINDTKIQTPTGQLKNY
jgi:hypothetical protein